MRRVHSIGSALLLIVASPAVGAEFFVDTQSLSPHMWREVPYIIPLAGMITTAPDFPYGQETPHFNAITGLEQPGRDGTLFSSGYSSQANIISNAVKSQLSSDGAQIAGGVREDLARSYRTGSDQLVNYGYERTLGALAGKLAGANGAQINFSANGDYWHNAKLPNSAADATDFSQGGASAGLSLRPTGWFDTVDAVGRWIYVMSEADTYNLRTPGALRLRQSNSVSTMGFNVRGSHESGADRTTVGMNALHGYRNSDRLSPGYGENFISSWSIPAVTINKMGIEADHRHQFQFLQAEAGLRYDLATSAAADIGHAPNTGLASYDMAPRQMYQTYYGTSGPGTLVYHTVSGRLHLETSMGQTVPFLDIRHLVRTPTVSEQWLASTGPSYLVQVGNPTIAPEQHNGLELGGTTKGGGYSGYGPDAAIGGWQTKINISQDWVKDFITLDTARGQPGILMNNNAIIVRNVDASVQTFTWNAEYQPWENWGFRTNVGGEWGRNMTDHRPLYQMAAVDAQLMVDWFKKVNDLRYNLGISTRIVGPMTDVDASTKTGSGQDNIARTGGFTLLNLYGGVQLWNRIGLDVGIDNILDRLYREHIAAYPQGPGTSLPYCAGRSFHGRLVIRF